MHFSYLPLAGLLLASEVTAFPAGMDEALMARAASAAGCPHMQMKRDEVAKQKRSTFDAKAQLIDVTGAHAFVPPGPGDERGPCPGLNALANHNYLPHNGIATGQQLIDATNKVYGMSLDLGGFLALYGTIFDGNPLSLTPGYSIGGPAPADNPIAGKPLGLFSLPKGLSGSHNKYETDTSATRGDLYLYGNNYKVQIHQFNQYYSALKVNQPSEIQYQNLAAFHAARHKDSRVRNPNFFYSPFAGVLVAPAAFSFPVRMMSNHSSKYPDGYLDRETFKSFFSVTGSPGKFVYTEGHERIPNNWYRRAIGDDYSIPSFLLDVVAHGLQYPELLIPGGNTGKKDSFTPINLSSLTKGVFSLTDLTDPKKLGCFLYQISQAPIPDILVGTTQSAVNLVAQWASAISPYFAGLNCPTLQGIDKSQLSIYPGYNANPVYG